MKKNVITTYGSNKDNLDKLCRLYIENNLKNTKAYFFCSPDDIDYILSKGISKTHIRSLRRGYIMLDTIILFVFKNNVENLITSIPILQIEDDGLGSNVLNTLEDLSIKSNCNIYRVCDNYTNPHTKKNLGVKVIKDNIIYPMSYLKDYFLKEELNTKKFSKDEIYIIRSLQVTFDEASEYGGVRELNTTILNLLFGSVNDINNEEVVENFRLLLKNKCCYKESIIIYSLSNFKFVKNILSNFIRDYTTKYIPEDNEIKYLLVKSNINNKDEIIIFKESVYYMSKIIDGKNSPFTKYINMSNELDKSSHRFISKEEYDTIDKSNIIESTLVYEGKPLDLLVTPQDI